jgi:membrane associated rhomboid family serine protease
VKRWNATSGPVVTKLLVALNLVVYLLTLGQSNATGTVNDLQSRLALYGPAVARGEWYRLVTAGFVHYGLLHVAFNMALLYAFGNMLEPALGRVRLAALYIAALLTGSLGALILTPLALTAGASGAVFGLVGAAAVGLRQRGIGVWQSGVGVLLVVNLVFTFGIPGISIGGHLGGLAGGAALGSFMLRQPPTRRSTIDGLLVATALAAAAIIGSIAVAHAAR